MASLSFQIRESFSDEAIASTGEWGEVERPLGTGFAGKKSSAQFPFEGLRIGHEMDVEAAPGG
ncbi:MAG: hypothetical protein AAGA56_19145, partial [Myxococcota bacterium]